MNFKKKTFKELLKTKPLEDITYTDYLKCNEWIEKHNEIIARDNQKCRICKTTESIGPIFSGDDRFFHRRQKGKVISEKHPVHLEVHHKLYIRDRLPWDYENDDLITVCDPCHRKIHKEEKISFYDKERNKLFHFEPCSRCGGTGNIPHYNHVQGGICFKCWGAGTKTPIFINKKTLLD